MAALIHILHLQDDPLDRELVQVKLEEAGLSCRFTKVQTRDEFENALEQGPFDIILADYRLPAYDGLSALGLVLERCPDIPFIFVSGTIDEDAAIEALTEGATDYVLKPKLTRLGPAVHRALREARNQRQRRQAEQELAQSEAMKRTILDSVDQGFIVIDREYRILTVNRAFCNMLNLREDKMIGRLCHEIRHQGTRPCFASGLECPVQHTFESGLVHAALHTHSDASGAHRYMELKSYPIFDASGTVVTAIETLHDVTEKRKLQEQLVQSQKMESVARLAGGVAHDFNNMLSVIIGHTELAMDHMKPDQPLYADLKEILKAAERSAGLTRQLLAFARKQAVEPQVLDLNQTVTTILKMLRPLIGEDIDLVWRPAAALAPVKMDPSQVDQILANLCINARDAIVGVGRIRIETAMAALGPGSSRHPDFVPGEYVMLTIRDDGCGIDPQNLGHIFEPFYTTKEMGRGTGLGLATVYGIVRQNGGFIDVDSNLGRGATFRICLPLHADKTVVKRQRIPEVLARGDHETILLVEDEEAILNLAKLMLEKLGYQVLAASTPREAMRLADVHGGTIRLLIVDVVMPEMNGRELANQLTAQCPQTACLYMSGYTGDAVTHHGILDEGVHFIQKPFSLSALAAKVREVLVQGKKKSKQPLRSSTCLT
jgi:two-component system cell cycle sensor histidine kinase/response regulator CckA